MPLTIMISVLKYRLWDIDALIRRALACVLITAIWRVYLYSVLVLQVLFNWLVGRVIIWPW
jgi:hypothetical protein